MDRLVALCVLMTAAMGLTSAVDLNQRERDAMTDGCNELRSKEGAADMSLMASCRNHNIIIGLVYTVYKQHACECVSLL